MEYDDFSLASNFEKLATEYYKALEKKGFVFIRLDENEKEKQILIDKIYTAMRILLTSLRKMPMQKSRLFSKLINLTEIQIGTLKETYNYKKEEIPQTNMRMTIENLIGLEADILKKLFALYEIEDGENEHVLLKNMINERLGVFAN